MTLSAHMERVYAVTAMLKDDPDGVSIESVKDMLDCGRNQAGRAIRAARQYLAGDGYAVSYANNRNEFTVKVDGDPNDRARSYFKTLRDVNTRRQTSGKVIEAAGTRPSATPHERALQKMVRAQRMSDEADRVRIEAMAELLDDDD